MSNILVGQGASLPGQSGISGCLPASVGEPGGQAGLELLGQAGMVAVRVADLASPAREGLGKDGRTALVAAGAGKIGTGDLVVFCKPVVVAVAVVRRDGRVQAAGHPADHVRLGVAEQRLDALCGEPGVIGKVADPQAYPHTAGQQSSCRAGSQRQISAPGLRDSPGTPEARTRCG